ncbi:MAG: pyridoxamine 5'-phosphate oxidase family protein [Fibromonadaceae bacterium]|jgi:nitroimidazol reductase NimA-like FMN-containing flavoprotein (pyridoxamine 5'-phosphate oxidase superfamily)|nr:pyridoxamine 5'-phosphate oxidase family protein [Fibromonadaceae bacterium]
MKSKTINAMRRKDKEIVDVNDKINVVKKCKVCRLALSENDMPYIVPLNYGYIFENETLTLFFHGAVEGKKLDIIRINSNACFEIDCDRNLVEGKTPLDYGFAFKSIIGFGKIVILEEANEKTYGLNQIMKHQTEKDTIYDFTNEQLKGVCVYKMLVETFTGKQSPAPKQPF